MRLNCKQIYQSISVREKLENLTCSVDLCCFSLLTFLCFLRTNLQFNLLSIYTGANTVVRIFKNFLCCLFFRIFVNCSLFKYLYVCGFYKQFLKF
jgi:hypothetical protein